MSRLAPLLSSARLDWETPPELFVALDMEFKFRMDAAANAANAKCPLWLGPGSPIAEDALSVDWPDGPVFLNPPYGRLVGRFVAKAHEQSRRGAVAPVVALLPARPDTQWWARHVMQAYEVWFIRGRVTFVGAPHPAPFPSCIVVWRCGSRPWLWPKVTMWDWRRAE